MANNTITFKIKVGDDGTFDIITNKAEKASEATEDLGKNTDRLNKKRNDYSKQEKGVSGATSNSTKAFAKQAQTIGSGNMGLVAAYATLMANVFALSQAFNFLSRAAGVDQLIQGLQVTGEIGGRNLKAVADELRNISGGALSAADSMKSVALGVSAGFSTEQMEGLARVATGASKALGRDLVDAMDRLTRGAAKLESEIVDELGIMVRLDKTTNDFAASIGVTAEEVTDFQKRMAFTNEIIKQGEMKFGDLIDAVPDNAFTKLASTFTDLSHSIASIINTAVTPLISILANNPMALLAVIGLIGSRIFKTLIPSLSEMGDSMTENIKATAKLGQASAKSVIGMTGLSQESKTLAASMGDGNVAIEDQAHLYGTIRKNLDANLGRHKKSRKAQKELGFEMGVVNGRIFEQVNALGQLRTSIALTAVAEAQEHQNLALESFLRGDIIAGFKDLFNAHKKGHKETKKGTKNMGKFGKATVFTRVQVTLLNTSLKTMGVLMAKFAPLLFLLTAFAGTIIKMGKAIVNFIVGEDHMGKAMKENEEIISSLNNISNRYVATIMEMTDANARFERTAHTMGGALEQIIKGLDNISAAEVKTDADGGLIGALPGLGKSDVISMEGRAAVKSFIGDTTEQLDRMREAVSSDVNALQMLNTVQANLDSLVGLDSPKAFAKQMAILREQQAALAGYNEGITAAAKSNSDLSAAIAKLKKKATTPYDDINDKIQEQVKLLNDAKNADEQFGTGQTAQLRRAEAILGLERAATEEDIKQIRADAALFDTKRESLASSKENVKLKQEELKAVKGFAGKATEIFEIELQREDALRRAREQQLEDEKALVLSRDDLKEDNDRLLQIAKELKALQQSERSEAEKTALITQSSLKEQKTLFDLRSKGLKLILDTNKAVREGGKLELERRNLERQAKVLKGPQAQAEADNLKFLRETEMQKRKDAHAQMINEIQKIELDFKLQEVKFVLLEAELEKLGKESGNIAEAKILLTQQRAFAEKFARQKGKNAQAGITNELLGARNAFNDARFSGVGSGGVNFAANALFNMGANVPFDNLLPAVSANTNLKDNPVITEGKAKAKTPAQLAEDAETARRAEAAAANQPMMQEVTVAAQKPLTTQVQEGLQSFGFGAEDGQFEIRMDTIAEKVKGMQGILNGFAESFKELGPEGEAIAMALEGISSFVDNGTAALEMFASAGTDVSMQLAAGFSAVAAGAAALSSIIGAAAKMKKIGIDKEIAAEKKRDGQSAKSVALIKKMEKEKEEIDKKTFERQKKLMLLQAVMATAAGIAMAFSMGIPGIPFGILIGALGAAQISVIRGMEYEGGAADTPDAPPSQINVGARENKIDLANANNASGELGYMRGEQGVGTGATNFQPAFTGTRYRAEGGRVGYMVGEQGPELFMPDQAGEIMSAGETEDALTGGESANVTFNINTIDASGVAEVLTAQRSNIIGMIRESANNIGEPFLEGVT